MHAYHLGQWTTSVNAVQVLLRGSWRYLLGLGSKGADFGDGDGRCVGSEDSLGFGHTFEIPVRDNLVGL